MYCVFMCGFVYNMMCVSCCVHLCVIGYIYGRQGTLGLENITLGVRKTIMNMKISKIEFKLY